MSKSMYSYLCRCFGVLCLHQDSSKLAFCQALRQLRPHFSDVMLVPRIGISFFAAAGGGGQLDCRDGCWEGVGHA